jgi:hypothetical protein
MGHALNGVMSDSIGGNHRRFAPVQPVQSMPLHETAHQEEPPMSQLTTHPLRRSAALALAVAGVCVLGACADDDPVTAPAQPGSGDTSDPDTPVTSSPGDPSTPPSVPAGEPIPADLTVKVDDGNGTTSTYSLTCVPEGGQHPAAADACAALAAAGAEAFGPPPKDQMCTEQYGGPQTATVTGTLAGKPVRAQFARTDGCEIGRWAALSALFGPVAGVEG